METVKDCHSQSRSACIVLDFVHVFALDPVSKSKCFCQRIMIANVSVFSLS